MFFIGHFAEAGSMPDYISRPFYDLWSWQSKEPLQNWPKVIISYGDGFLVVFDYVDCRFYMQCTSKLVPLVLQDVSFQNGIQNQLLFVRESQSGVYSIPISVEGLLLIRWSGTNRPASLSWWTRSNRRVRPPRGRPNTLSEPSRTSAACRTSACMPPWTDAAPARQTCLCDLGDLAPLPLGETRTFLVAGRDKAPRHFYTNKGELRSPRICCHF